MIRPGLCSITFESRSAEEALEFGRAAGLRGIEWWGGKHAPPGDLARARELARLTQAAGLAVSSYGSYYRVGISEAEGLEFATVLETARALEAPVIRIWAGNRDYAATGQDQIRRMVTDTLHAGDMAGRAGLTIAFEFHPGTLTDRNETAVRFASAVRHPAVRFYWQPPFGRDVPYGLAGLNALCDRLANLHVFHWTLGAPDRNTVHADMRPLVFPEDFHRHPLADGVEEWRQYLAAAATAPGDRWALLEFVKDNDPAQFMHDAQTLLGLTSCALPASV